LREPSHARARVLPKIAKETRLSRLFLQPGAVFMPLDCPENEQVTPLAKDLF
jgi:hypothetical protein